MTNIITGTAAIRAKILEWRSHGLSSVLVPTMGGLHDGHIALIDHARKTADRVVVSIYVNPTQFSPSEDFDEYPRQLESDLALIGDRADVVFTPSTLYADDHATSIVPAGPALGLEAIGRPHFFAGVATIVLKLFNQMPVDKAVFGEKDYQQLMVIRQMVRDLDLSIDILSHPTVRDPDGLALSSRNSYLDPAQSRIAAQFNVALRDCAAAINDGAPVAKMIENATAKLIDAGFDAVEYLALCDNVTLTMTSEPAPQNRLLAAVHLGAVRLIDNIALGDSTGA